MTKRFDGSVCRFVEFFIGMIAEKIDVLEGDDEEEAAAPVPAPKKENFSQGTFLPGEDGLMQVPDNMDLPFD